MRTGAKACGRGLGSGIFRKMLLLIALNFTLLLRNTIGTMVGFALRAAQEQSSRAALGVTLAQSGVGCLTQPTILLHWRPYPLVSQFLVQKLRHPGRGKTLFIWYCSCGLYAILGAKQVRVLSHPITPQPV